MSALDTPARPTIPEGPPPRTVWLVGGLIFVALIVIAVVAAVLWPRYSGDRSEKVHTVTGAVDGRDEAALDVLSSAAAVTVRAADLGDTLFRVRSPQTPSATAADGRVQVRVAGGDASLAIELNRDVRWSVRFTAGAQSNTADLRDLHRLAGVEYVGGVSAVELSLPGPAGTVPVRLDGGAGSVRIHAPGGVPVRVRAGGGAGGVTVDGTVHNGVSAGSTFVPPGWDTAEHRYDVDAAAGVSTVVVDRLA